MNQTKNLENKLNGALGKFELRNIIFRNGLVSIKGKIE